MPPLLRSFPLHRQTPNLVKVEAGAILGLPFACTLRTYEGIHRPRVLVRDRTRPCRRWARDREPRSSPRPLDCACASDRLHRLPRRWRSRLDLASARAVDCFLLDNGRSRRQLRKVRRIVRTHCGTCPHVLFVSRRARRGRVRTRRVAPSVADPSASVRRPCSLTSSPLLLCGANPTTEAGRSRWGRYPFTVNRFRVAARRRHRTCPRANLFRRERCQQ